MDSKALDWVKQAKKDKLSEMKIVQHLKELGWSNQEIDKVLVSHYQVAVKESDPLQPNRPQLEGFWKLFKKSLATYRANAKELALASFLGIVFVVVLEYLFALAEGILKISNFFNGSEEVPLSTSLAWLTVSVLFLLCLAFIYSWLQSVTILAINRSSKNLSVLKKSFFASFRLWKINIIASLLIIGAFAFFILPGIIFSIWFSLIAFIVVLEKINGFSVILLSKDYLKDLWWPVFLRIFCFFLVILVFITGINIFLKIIGIGYLSKWLALGVALFIMPLGVCFLNFIYANIKKIKKNNLERTVEKSKIFLIPALGWLLLPFFTIIIIAFLTSSRDQAVDQQRENNLVKFKNYIMQYQRDNLYFPSSLAQVKPYYPKDFNVNMKNYSYSLSSNGRIFRICTHLITGADYCLSGSARSVKNPSEKY